MVKRQHAFIGISLLGFVAFLDFTIVNTALPVIQKSLTMSIVSLSWILNIYYIVLACLMVVAGKFGDVFGHKTLFYIGGLLFIVASLIAGLANTGGLLIFGRFLQAVGAAILFPMAASLISAIFEDNATKALGIYGAVGGAGLAIGPLLGAILTSYISWRAIFLVNVPVCLLGLVMLYFTLPKKQQTKKVTIDWAGLILFIIGIVGVIYGIINSATAGWLNLFTLLPIILGFIFLIIFVLVENKVNEPLLAPSLFKRPLFLIGSMICMMGGIATSIVLFFAPLYLHSIRHISIMLTGLILFTVTLVYIIFSTFINKLVSKCGLINVIMSGMISALVAALLLYFMNLTISVYFLILPCALIGFCWACGNILSVVAVHESTPKEQIGVATGMVYTLFDIGGSITLAIATVVFNAMEKSSMSLQLQSANLTLPAGAHQKIASALSDPTHALQILNQLGLEANKLFIFFQQSFVTGFRGAISVLVVIIFLTLIATFYARMKHNKN